MRFILGLLFFASTAHAVTYPGYVGYVNDYANLMSPDQRQAIENTIGQNVKAGGWQIAVVTVPDLRGLDVESYANGLFRNWGIGTKEKNDGVLLLLSLNPRKVRIEVGSGIEGDLPDIICARIIRDNIVPHLKARDFYGAFSLGVKDIIAVKPKVLTEEEKQALAIAAAEQEKKRKEEAIANEKKRKADLLDQMLREQEEQRKRNLEELQSAENWKHTKANILYWLTAILVFSPVWGTLLFLYVRKSLREKAIRDEAERVRLAKEEAERKRREAQEAAERREREAKEEAERRERARLRAIQEAKEEAERQERARIAHEKEMKWRRENPEAAREKDRKEAEERERERLAAIAAATAAAALAARRKREEEEEGERRRRRQREESERRSRDDDSGSGFSFGGFGGGSSSGGGASSGW